MYEELEYEFSQFLKDINNEKFIFEGYFYEDDCEDEYSHNDINFYQGKLVEKIKDYLHKNRPGEFIVSSSWAVFVMTIEEARRRKVYRIDDLIVH